MNRNRQTRARRRMSRWIPSGIEPLRLPDWAVQAWPVLVGDHGLGIALNAVYEGMQLEQRHPSLAHLTFVAGIEGYGARFVEDAPCDCGHRMAAARLPRVAGPIHSHGPAHA